MSDIVVDSSVAAKWVLPESDSAQAQQLIVDAVAAGHRLIVLDLVFPEVANAIWKRHRQGLITLAETRAFLDALMLAPVVVEPAVQYLATAMDIAVKYDRAVYDALFVALANNLGIPGVTADEPLVNAIAGNFPQIKLLRNWP